MRNRSYLMLGLAFAIAFPSLMYAQPCRVIGGGNTDKASSIIRSVVPVDGYVLAGMTRSFGPGVPNCANAVVVNTDSFGIPVRAVVTTGAQDEEATSLIMTSDKSYVVAGWTRSSHTTTTNADIFVMKLSTNLGVIWSRVYHILPYDYDHVANSIIEVSSGAGGGYALAGWFSPNGTNREILVIRLDASGYVIWAYSYKFPNDNYDEGFAITEVNDPGMPEIKFAVVGRRAVSSTTVGDAFCLRLKADGNIASCEVLPGRYDDVARSVLWDGSGTTPGIVVAGWTKSYGNGTPSYANIFVSKLKSAGGTIWANVYHWPTGTTEYDDQLLGDKALIVPSSALGGGYALCGWTRSRGPNTPNYSNFLLAKLKYDGSIDWDGLASVHPSVTSYNYHDEAWSLIETKSIPTLPAPGQGYALAGWSTSFNPGTALSRENILFSTFDAQGRRPAGCAEQYPFKSSPISWAGLNPQRFTRTCTTGTLSVTACTLTHRAVCYGTFSGVEPENRNITDAGQLNPQEPNLVIVPNPVRGTGTIHYALPHNTSVRLGLYDVQGRFAGGIISGTLTAGKYTTRLDTRRLTKGLYFLRLETDQLTFTEKLLVE